MMAEINPKGSNKPKPQGLNEPAEFDRESMPEVAGTEENKALQHSQGGVTTRDDANDLGVPMLPGSPNEPVGPEDALGEGPKRGDYRNRVGGDSYQPHDGPVPQKPRVEDIGDAAGQKGGVDTDPKSQRR